MKKKIVNGLLLMAFAMSSVSTFVACKDYDEDVYVDLKSRISKEASLREALQQQVNELDAYVKSLEKCKCDLSDYLKKSEADRTYMSIADYEANIYQISANKTAIELINQAIDQINARIDQIKPSETGGEPQSLDEVISKLNDMNNLILEVQAKADEALKMAKEGKCDCDLSALDSRVTILEGLVSGWNQQLLDITEIEIPATGHKADSIQFENIVAATCTVAGSKDSVVYCSVCGVEVSRTKIEIPATGHTVVVDSAVAATATETGLTEGSHCSVCGETIVAQEVIPATGEQGGEGNGSEGGNENQGGNENTEPATAVAESAAQQVSIYSHHNIIVVENADAEIFVYNIMGNLVATANDANAEIVINTTGVYIVKVGGTSKRVMINN